MPTAKSLALRSPWLTCVRDGAKEAWNEARPHHGGLLAERVPERHGGGRGADRLEIAGRGERRRDGFAETHRDARVSRPSRDPFARTLVVRRDDGRKDRGDGVETNHTPHLVDQVDLPRYVGAKARHVPYVETRLGGAAPEAEPLEDCPAICVRNGNPEHGADTTVSESDGAPREGARLDDALLSHREPRPTP